MSSTAGLAGAPSSPDPTSYTLVKIAAIDWDVAADIAQAHGQPDWANALRWGYMDRRA
jgi:hypothetical protein